MTAFAGIRGPVAFGIVALLLLAAVAPACLMSPATAMATPKDNAPGSDCDRSEGTLSGCPYSQDEDRSAVVSAPDLGQSLVAASPATAVADAGDLGLPTLFLLPGGSPPLASLTPLRL